MPPQALVPVTVQVDPDLAQPPFDETAPGDGGLRGWSLSVWARVPEGAAGPHGLRTEACLVSIPSSGQGGARPAEWGRSSVVGAARRGWTNRTGLAFSGSNALRSRKATRSTPTTTPDGAASNRRNRGGGALPDARSPDLARRVCNTRLKKRCRRPGWSTVLLHRLDGQTSTAGDRTAKYPATRHHHCGFPPGGRARSAVRDGRAKRDRSGDRARRFGVDGGQQPRQTPANPPDSRGHPRLRQRPSARGARPADGQTRIGLALLQSRWAAPRTCPSSATLQTNADGSQARLRQVCRRSSRGLGAHRRSPWVLSFTESVLPAPYASGCASSACTGRGNRQPPASARGGVLFPLAERQSRQSADPCRRLPGRRRHAVGAARSPR